MARQLVVLLDGTGNRIGIQPSNITRMLPLLDQDPDRLLCHYDQGVGTFGRPGVLFEWQNLPARLLGLAFGWGTRITVERAYRFLCEHYRQGDQLYLFGFSRGAYAARLLAAVIHRYGLLPPQHLTQFPHAWNALVHRVGGFPRMAWIKQAFAGRPARITLLGLYDTVNSTGWISNPFNVPNTVNNPSVEHVRHALSLDERRSFFSPLLWGPAGSPRYQPDARIQQVWFAGVHSDVGGGYAMDQSGLASCALDWMLGEAAALGLALDSRRCHDFMDKKRNHPHATAPAHRSDGGLWTLTEWLPRRRWHPARKAMAWQLGHCTPLRDARRVLDPQPWVHRSVQLRQHADPHYQAQLAALQPQWVDSRPWGPAATAPEAATDQLRDACPASA